MLEMITLPLAALEQRAGLADAEAEQLPGQVWLSLARWDPGPPACWTGRQPRCALSTGSRAGTVLVWPPSCCAPSVNRSITGFPHAPYRALQSEENRKYSAICANLVIAPT